MKGKDSKEMNPLLKSILKISLLTIIVGSIIMYSDYKGYFNPDKTNDHTIRKWNTFYDMEKNGMEIDIMLFGNSHLYTGINPKNLSLSLGANSFIIASPGTNTADNYFALKEAIKVQKPKLVIVETYGVNNFNPYELKDGPLSNQIVSFSARKNTLIKLQSTPKLFAVDNYLYAWSTTLRNHDYIFSNKEQLATNKQLIKNNELSTKPNNKLYLGRYVRFTTGIEADIMERYANEGAPINGEEFKYSKYAELYVSKITQLCETEGIELIFLTLPMYEKHIASYENWDKQIAGLIQDQHWLNLQREQNYQGFDKYAFENTYKPSQHMTYNGSLMATYKLANYIRSTAAIELPDRTKDVEWHKKYYGDEGYFENYNPATNDPTNRLISANIELKNCKLSSLILLGGANGNPSKLIAKIDKLSIPDLGELKNAQLKLVLKYQRNGQIESSLVNLNIDPFYSPKNTIIFSSYLNPIDLKEVLDGELVY